MLPNSLYRGLSYIAPTHPPKVAAYPYRGGSGSPSNTLFIVPTRPIHHPKRHFDDLTRFSIDAHDRGTDRPTDRQNDVATRLA